MPNRDLTVKEAHLLDGIRRRILLAVTQHGLTQVEVSRRLGCQQSMVSEWLSGLSFPSGRYLVLLPQVLGRTPEQGINAAWFFTARGHMDLPNLDEPAPAAYLRGALAATAKMELALADLKREYVEGDAIVQRAMDAARLIEVTGAVRRHSGAGQSRRRA